MLLNITKEQLSLEDLKGCLDEATNLKDMYFLVHQAGCPVYLLRDVDNKVSIIWHPSLDFSKDAISLDITEGTITVKSSDGTTLPFEDIEIYRKSILLNHMLGKHPFNDSRLVWKNDSKCN